jgi:hypothetical protein
MQYFEKLGAAIQTEWNDRQRDLRVWPEIARRALAEARPCDHVTMADVLEWAVETDRLPTQADPTGTFGQPPITVYTGADFHIDVLFWIDGILTIHQHSFSGAFHVLAGSSVHSTYRFQPTSRLGPAMLAGDLSLDRAEYLARGDTRPIGSGSRTIHSLFHLDRPSATVVIRTRFDEGTSPQWEYRMPGIAIVASEMLGPPGAELLRRLSAIQALQLIDPDRAFAALRTFVAGCDAESLFRALDHSLLAGWLAREQFDALLDDARPRLGPLTDLFHAVFDETLRVSSLNRRRGGIHEPHHRYFIALLLNLSGRTTILDFVARRYAGNPVDVVMGWIAELGAVRPADIGRPNVLDIELDEASLLVLRCLLEGLPREALVERLRDEFDDVDAQADAIEELCRAFRSSRVFRTLLA